MEALLKRIWFLSECTIGELYLDNTFVCYVLEDIERADGVKVAGETCIPSGNYKIGKVFSPKHKKVCPVIYTEIVGSGDTPSDYIIKDVYNNVWSCVEMHSGNTAADSLACQILGLEKDIANQRVNKSRDACAVVYQKIFDGLQQGVINYSIVDALPSDAVDA